MSKLRWYHGVIITLISIGVLIFLCAPLQYYLGYTGLVLSELLLALVAIIPVSMASEKKSNVFPLSLPPAKKFFAASFMYAGIFCAMTVVILIEQILFPNIFEVSESLGNTITGLSPWMSVLVIAVIPAICEELLNRGTILFCFTHIKSNIAVILLSGVMFGIMHLDPVRFLPTAILGCFFAYLTVKTKSLFLPMLFHFLNNLISVVSAFISSDMSEETGEVVLSGVDLIIYCGYYAGIAILLLTIGLMIFNGMKKNAPLKIASIIIAVVLIIVSFALLLFGTVVEEYKDITSGKQSDDRVSVQTAFINDDSMKKYDKLSFMISLE